MQSQFNILFDCFILRLSNNIHRTVQNQSNSTDKENAVESVSVGEYENIKIKLSWKGDFTSTSEIYIDYVDNRNKRQYSPIAFELVNKEII